MFESLCFWLCISKICKFTFEVTKATVLAVLEGAVVSDNESEADDPKVLTGRRRDYVPCAEPGSRLPHMYVRILSDTTGEAVVSTLDLVSTDKVEFLLIIPPLQESYEKARATYKVAKEFMANVKVCVVWPSSDDGVKKESKSALAPWENYVDVMEVKIYNSEQASWWSICKLSEKGCILVRPDQQILLYTNSWRVEVKRYKFFCILFISK